MRRLSNRVRRLRVCLSQLSTLAALTILPAFTGCAPARVGTDATTDATGTVAEGVIFSVTYLSKEGRTSGFTRLNEQKAVPADEGSWNVDARGRLTRDYLFITRPQHPELGPEVIPASRVLHIQFGDGGIKQVNESQPK
jgi:hypothetical protein